jgi:DUF1680 family protein
MLQQMTNDLEQGFAGCLDRLTDHASSNTFGANQVSSFETSKSGMVHDTPRSWWDGETEAVWLDGFLRMAYLAGHAPSMEKADRLMSKLLADQGEDGYLGIYTPESRYAHPKENGEFWTQSRALIAMLDYYELTGREEFLAAVVRALDVTMHHYGPQRSYFSNEEPAGGTGHGLMIVDVLEWVYRLTGEQRFRDYGLWCYQDYSAASRIRDTDNQSQNLLDMDKGFRWHTPHTTEHLRVPLWAAFVSGESELRRATENSFAKIQRYLVPSGACIGNENIQDRPPAPHIPYEYCAITELLTSLQSAAQKTGLAHFSDLAEWLAFNAAQGARTADGRAISYLTIDNRPAVDPGKHSQKLNYSATHRQAAVCCNPNATKLLPTYVDRMWARLPDDAGLCAFCYGPSELKTQLAGERVEIRQETAYPFEETVRLHVKTGAPHEFELRLRIPAWAEEARIDVADAEVQREDGFWRVRKLWQGEETLTLRFTCAIMTDTTCEGEYFLRRGPLLYAMPIPEERKVWGEYEGEPDLVDFLPIPLEPDPDLRLKSGAADFHLDKDETADLLRPWHRTPFSLIGPFIDADGQTCQGRLIPIGCTLLRRTSFPGIKAGQNATSCGDHHS